MWTLRGFSPTAGSRRALVPPHALRISSRVPALSVSHIAAATHVSPVNPRNLTTVGARPRWHLLRLHAPRVVPCLPVLHDVSPRVHNLKVLRAIISLHPVQMMHLLGWQQRPPQYPLSYHPMLVALPSVVPHADVTVRRDPCHTPILLHPMLSGRVDGRPTSSSMSTKPQPSTSRAGRA